jgi:hypothetical protein
MYRIKDLFAEDIVHFVQQKRTKRSERVVKNPEVTLIIFTHNTVEGNALVADYRKVFMHLYAYRQKVIVQL